MPVSTTAGIKSLRRIQLGRETTAGTTAAATTIWRGTGVMQDDSLVVRPPEDIGIVWDTDRNYIPMQGGTLTLDAVPATFEQLPHLGEMGIKAIATGVADGTGSGKVYAYTFSTTAVNSFNPYTVETGDNVQQYVAAYGYLESLKLSGKYNEAINMSGTVKVRTVNKLSAFTTTATIPTVEEILFQQGVLYIDNASGTIGTTQVSATFLDFELDMKTGFKGVATGDGRLDFTFVKGTKPTGTLKVTFEHNASATAERDNWLAKTARLIRIKVQGSALTTAATYTNKTLIIDVAGKWSKFDAMKDDAGNDTVTGNFEIGYDSTYGGVGQILVVNQLASLP